MNKALEEIENIVKNFPWEEVHNLYVQNKWVWGPDLKIPSRERLEACGLKLLNEVMNTDKPSTSCSTGRLSAYKFPWGYKLALEPFSKTTY